MAAHVHRLWRSLVKGARGDYCATLAVDTFLGVNADRQVAIRKRPGDLTKWAPKGLFYVAMNTPQMPLEVPVFTDGLDRQYLAGLKERLGAPGDLIVQEAFNNYSLHDTMIKHDDGHYSQGAFVSFINLASLRALEKRVGKKLNPLRFRMNVEMEGFEPFEELGWIPEYHNGREMTVGGVRFKLDDACERCKAIEANPDTGEYDTDLRAALTEIMGELGYRSPQRGVQTVMGFYGVPLENGTLRLGEEIRVH